MIAMTERYARALVARNAAKLHDAIHAVQAHESDPITVHKLAEVASECAWCERSFNIEEGNGNG